MSQLLQMKKLEAKDNMPNEMRKMSKQILVSCVKNGDKTHDAYRSKDIKRRNKIELEFLQNCSLEFILSFKDVNADKLGKTCISSELIDALIVVKMSERFKWKLVNGKIISGILKPKKLSVHKNAPMTKIEAQKCIAKILLKRKNAQKMKRHVQRLHINKIPARAMEHQYKIDQLHFADK